MRQWHFLLAAIVLLGIVGWYVAARHEGRFNGTGLHRGQLVRFEEGQQIHKIHLNGPITHEVVRMGDDFILLEDVRGNGDLALSPLMVEVVR